MREIRKDLEYTKRRVDFFKGKRILFKVNTGRNKIIEFLGEIENLYPAIFTVKAELEEGSQIMTYSYSEVLMKNVKFYPAE